MGTELCASCRNITLSMVVTGFQRSLNYDQTQEARDHGCRLCNLVAHAYANQVCPESGCDKIHQGPLLWRIAGDGPGVRYGMFKLDYRHFGPPLTLAVSEESSLFQEKIITRRETQPAESSRNLRLLRSWLKECCLTHSECLRGSYSKKEFNDTTPSVTLPFRVVDVGSALDGADPPRLLTTHYKSIGRYLTLSHCWGKVMPLRTTMAIRDAWHMALPWAQLPKTFQDAITLTRELGERFLWIDSLCIVQDDPDEIHAQIQLMGVIFEGSYCTIVAVDAKGTDGSLTVDRGLFLSGPANVMATQLRLKTELSRTQPPRPNEPGNVEKARSWLEGKEHESSREVYEVVLENRAQLGPISNWLQKKRWHSRGWVFQERQLSRRCIFFTEDGLSWRCNRYWETEQTGVPECRERRTDFDLETSMTLGNYIFDTAFNLRMLWQASVEDYSETKLTYIKDKDKAIKGLEERLSTRFNAVFRFGVLDFVPFKEVLHRQLLWRPVASRGSSFKNSPDFCCPSWSWMIIDGAIRWSGTQLLTQPELIGHVSFEDSTVGQMQKLHILGLGQAVNLGAPFLKDLDLSREHDKQFPGTRVPWLDAVDADTNRIMSRVGKEMIGWIALDTTDEPGEIIAVPLIQYFRLDDEEDPMCVDFLALSKVSGKGGLYSQSGQQWYQRVGKGRVNKDAHTWLENCKSLSFVVI